MEASQARNVPARSVSPLWWTYVGLLLIVALLQSVSELQHYLANGGKHRWEPFVWEFSSILCTGLLCVAIYHWHVFGLQLGRWPLQLALHATGLVAYTLAHVGGMFSLRFAVYSLANVRYEPGDAQHILAYEAGKDFAGYVLIVAICHGLWLYFESQRRQQEMARLRGELAEARLSRLTEQIQPHFLFNTLNLISSVMYEDVVRADRLLCELAQLLRQALVAQESGSHTVAQELDLVEPYLSIMRARFGEQRLRISVEVSDEARTCLLPALLLISPVENAIKHDVALHAGPVHVSVRGWVHAGQLHLTVTNSGTAPERVQREGAIGLANTRARLRALYGAPARVELQASTDGGSLLSLSLPAEPIKNAA